MATAPQMFDIDDRQFVPSTEVARVAESVLDHHGRPGRIARLHGVRRAVNEGDITIAYLINAKPFDPTKDDVKHDAIAKCLKVPTLWHDQTAWDIVIWVRGWFWDQFDDGQREALLAHELLHVDVEYDEEGQVALGVRKHDLEEFTDVAQTFGGALPGIDPFIRAYQAFDPTAKPDGPTPITKAKGFSPEHAAAAAEELDRDLNGGADS